MNALQTSIATANSDVKAIKIATETFQKLLEFSYTKQNEAIASINQDYNEITVKLKDIENRERAVEDRIQKIALFIANDRDTRNDNYRNIQKSSKNIQIYLIIIGILLFFLIVYPFIRNFMKI